MKTTVILGDSWQWTEGDGDLLGVTLSLNEGQTPTQATIRIADPFLVLTNSLPLPQEDSRVPLEVFRGTKLFAGYLSAISNTGPPGVLTMTAVDKAKGLRRVPRARVLTNASAAQQARILAEGSGLTVVFQGDAEEELDQVQYGQRVQNGVSDIEFLNEMLTALGYTFQIRDTEIQIRQKGAVLDDPVQTLTLGTNGQIERWSFDIRELDRRTSPNVYSRAGESTFEVDPLLDPEVQARAVALERTGILFEAEDLPSFTDQTIEQAMSAQARAKKLFLLNLNLDTLYLDLDVDTTILLRGFGGRLSGVWNVEQVEHPILPKGKTSVRCYNGGGDDSGGVIGFVSDRVYFDFDIDTIRADQETVLDRVAARMLAAEGSRLVVQGHADETGTDEYNRALSRRRAESVRDGLIARGIDGTRLAIEAKGESQPAGEDDALNRRVQFKVY